MSDVVEQAVVGDLGQRASSEAGDAAGVLPAAAVEVPVTTAAPIATASATAVQAPVPPDRPRRRGRSDEEVAYWRGFVDEWHRLVAEAVAAGGLLPTVRGFCEQRELREPSFYWWRREFAIRNGKPLPTTRHADSTRIASHLGAQPQEAAFVRLRVKPTPGAYASAGTLCELVVGRFVLRVSPGFDAAELARLLDLLTTRAG